METYDPEKAARVWQRVRATAPAEPDSGNLLALIAGEWADAATYLYLSRGRQGKEAAALRRLFEEEQAHAACLKGIYTLTTGQKPVIRTPPPVQEPIEVTLRRCYGREMRSLAEYEARSADPEYGPVFARLAAQEREHCRIVLELIGSLKPKGGEPPLANSHRAGL